MLAGKGWQHEGHVSAPVGNFPWWLRQYPLSISRELCFVCSAVLRCVVLCCAVLRCFFWAVLSEWWCLGAQMTASHDGKSTHRG